MSATKTAPEFKIVFDKFYDDFQEKYAKQAIPSGDATAYVLEGSGKRVRPLLTLLSFQALAKHSRCAEAAHAALAVEWIHTYSLVHDDLPCMDDDAERRGRPTAHVAFDEAQALLAGDALLTDAFGLLCSAAVSNPKRLALIQELSIAAGGSGMVSGQSLDLHWTGRGTDAPFSVVKEIHLRKTGYLLGAACAMGGICALSDEDAREPNRIREHASIVALRESGRSLGVAFQLIDDLIDQNPETGKTAGKDAAAGKLTSLTNHTHEEVKDMAAEYTTKALDRIKPFGESALPLLEFVQDLLERQK